MHPADLLLEWCRCTSAEQHSPTQQDIIQQCISTPCQPSAPCPPPFQPVVPPHMAHRNARPASFGRVVGHQSVGGLAQQPSLVPPADPIEMPPWQAMFQNASNPDPQMPSSLDQASQVAKLLADNAALCSEIHRQAVQVVNSQQAATEAASRWAGKARPDVVPDPFTAETDVEAVNQWARRSRDMVDSFVRHLKQYFTRTSTRWQFRGSSAVSLPQLSMLDSYFVDYNFSLVGLNRSILCEFKVI